MSYNNVMPGKLNLKGGLPAPGKKYIYSLSTCLLIIARIRKKKPNEEPKKASSAEVRFSYYSQFSTLLRVLATSHFCICACSFAAGAKDGKDLGGYSNAC